MKYANTLMIAAALLFTSNAALAHTDDYLDTQKSPNGGQVRMAGIYHFELVVAKAAKESKESPVVVYVTDHAGTKVSIVGAGGTAILFVGKQKVTVNLLPDGDNRLKGVGRYASTPEMKAVVSITLAGKAMEQARFTPLTLRTPTMPTKGDHSEHNH